MIERKCSALFPILHLVADLPIIKELTDQPRRLARSLVVGGSKLGINQAVFVEKDQVIFFIICTCE